MEKVSVKDLYQRFVADKKSTKKLFITNELAFNARDIKVYQIKNIAPNPRKAEAIRNRDEYEDYVPDFDFEVVDIDTKETKYLDGHAGFEYFVTTDKDVIVEFNKIRIEKCYVEEVRRAIRVIKVPQVNVVGERTAHLNELVSELESTITKIIEYTKD